MKYQFNGTISCWYFLKDDLRYRSITCYDKFLKKGNRASYGGSSRPSLPSTALSTPFSSQPSVATRNSTSVGEQLLDPAPQAEQNVNAPDEGVDFRVDGWTCTPEKQAKWKKKGEDMSLDQLKAKTKELQDNLATARNERRHQEAALKSKIDRVCKLEAKLEEYKIVLDKMHSRDKTQRQLGETLGTTDYLGTSDTCLGIVNEYFKKHHDPLLLVQEINSYYFRKLLVVTSLKFMCYHNKKFAY